MDTLTTSHLDKKARQFLNSIKVGSIKKSDIELVYLAPDDSVEVALKKLSLHAISSAPIFDPNKQQIVGHISVLDLTAWIVQTYASSKGDLKEFNYTKLLAEFGKPLRELLPFTTEPNWPVTEETPLDALINCYFKWRIHRAVVVDKNRVTGSVSQSDVVAFLANHLSELGPIMGETIQDLGLVHGPVLSVLKGKPLIDVFSQIQETKFTGLAILTEDSRLYNNVSASDMKGITKETFWKLDLPIEKVLKEREKLPPLTCTPDTTLGEVLKKMADCRVHRIYVVDVQGRPTNVITHTTIMKIFSPTGSECFG